MGLQTRQARRDHLRAAAEAGEEMRLDEAGGDPEVCLDRLSCERQRDVTDHPEVDQARRVARVVVEDAPHPQHLITEHRPTLLSG